MIRKTTNMKDISNYAYLYKGLSTEYVDNPNGGKYRIVDVDTRQRVLDNRFFDTEEEARKRSREMSCNTCIIKLPNKMWVYKKN